MRRLPPRRASRPALATDSGSGCAGGRRTGPPPPVAACSPLQPAPAASLRLPAPSRPACRQLRGTRLRFARPSRVGSVLRAQPPCRLPAPLPRHNPDTGSPAPLPPASSRAGAPASTPRLRPLRARRSLRLSSAGARGWPQAPLQLSPAPAPPVLPRAASPSAPGPGLPTPRGVPVWLPLCAQPRRGSRLVLHARRLPASRRTRLRRLPGRVSLPPRRLPSSRTPAAQLPNFYCSAPAPQGHLHVPPVTGRLQA